MPWKEPMELLSKLGDFLLEKVLIIVPVVVISLIAIKIIMKLVDRMLGRLPLEDTIKRLIRTAVKVLLLAVAAIVLMSCLEIPVTSFVALLSVVGLALSLSIQNFLSNVFAGLQLLASKPFKVGDYVDAGNCSGTVYEVGLFIPSSPAWTTSSSSCPTAPLWAPTWSTIPARPTAGWRSK